MKKPEASIMEKKKIEYPIGSEYYQLYEEIGHGATASVYRALCTPLKKIVAIKILDSQHVEPTKIARETKAMLLVDHPNVVKSHCSFVTDHNLWIVMPYMDVGSCHHILKTSYPKGITDEIVIGTILFETLKGLNYLHGNGFIHRDIKAGNILVDSTSGAIKLGDLGVSAFLFDSGDRVHGRNTFTGTPCWMAPEVVDPSEHGYGVKADIWSFGITALELAHGHAPFSNHPPYKVLLMTLQDPPPGLGNYGKEPGRKFSKAFKRLISVCLVKDPSKRPSAEKLLKHDFFKNVKSKREAVVRKIIEGLPLATLGERLQSLKVKEEDMLAKKKVSDGKKEEISQDEYKRGISDWNFNMDVIREQALLDIDLDTITDEKDQGASSSVSLAGLVDNEKVVSPSQGDEASVKLPSINGINIPEIPQEVAAASVKVAMASGGEIEKKLEGQVVRQRGRFKMISENVMDPFLTM